MEQKKETEGDNDEENKLYIIKAIDISHIHQAYHCKCLFVLVNNLLFSGGVEFLIDLCIYYVKTIIHKRHAVFLEIMKLSLSI